jgi:ATP-dependent Clp protease ATP-binding subunit ClpA
MNDIRYSIELKTALGLAGELSPSPAQVSPEFVLLSLLKYPGEFLRVVLDLSRIDTLGLIEQVRQIAEEPHRTASNEPPPSAVVARALEVASAEALAMRSSAVFPEHLFLGLVEVSVGQLGSAFRKSGAAAAQVRNVIASQSHRWPRGPEPTSTEPPPSIDQLRAAIRTAGIRDDALAFVADLLPPALVSEFMAALDALHRAYGGGGLVIESDHVGVAAGTREVVG